VSSIQNRQAREIKAWYKKYQEQKVAEEKKKRIEDNKPEQKDGNSD